MFNKKRALSTKNPNVKAQLVARMAKVMNKIGLSTAYGFLRSRLVGSQSVIIAYHRICGEKDYPWSLSPITTQNFEKEMIYLRDRYEIISLEELCDFLNNRNTLPPKTAVITFDDGYKDVYLNAYPILKKYSMPATIFLSTDYISSKQLFWWDKVGYVIWQTKLDTLDLGELVCHKLDSANNRRLAFEVVQNKLKLLSDDKRRETIDRLIRICCVEIPPGLGEEHVLSWDNVKEMSQNNISFGSHTVNHPILTRLPPEAAKKEILDSKRRIEMEIGKEITTFCYPNGGLDDRNSYLEDTLKSNGFKCAIILSPVGFVSFKTKPYELPRITGASNPDTFEILLSGVYLDILTLLNYLTR